MRDILLGLIFITSASETISAPSTREIINQNLKQIVHLMGDGIAEQDPSYTNIYSGNIFGQNKKDVVAIFALSGFNGGNSYEEYFAFFQYNEPYKVAGRKNRPYSLVSLIHAGGKSWRGFESKSGKIEHGVFTISGETWAKDDANCCPSLPITISFKYENGELVEFENKNAPNPSINRDRPKQALCPAPYFKR